jgi:DnaA family protein
VNTPRQLVLELLAPAAPTLENFVIGRNAEAVEALGRLAAGAAGERIVYLWGEPGCGRSHLLQALAAVPGARPWRADEAPDAGGLTLVDDVEQLDEAAQISLFNRLNAVRARADAACVAAGSLPPARLPLREDLRTRLAWGHVLQLAPVSEPETRAALRREADRRGIFLSDDVMSYLLSRFDRDLKHLMALLDRLDRFALAEGRAVTVPLIKRMLAEQGEGLPA